MCVQIKLWSFLFCIANIGELPVQLVLTLHRRSEAVNKANVLLLVAVDDKKNQRKRHFQAAFTSTERPERSILSNELRVEKDDENKNGHRSKIAQ